MRPSTPPEANDEAPLANPDGEAFENPHGAVVPGLELGGQLHEGLFSVILKARATTSEGYEEVVALKLFKPNAKLRGTYKPLQPSLSALKHVNVVRHFSEGTTLGGTPYIVMEYARGQTLAELLAHGPIEVSRAVAISRQLARALVALHGANLVHGDLKPSHVLLVEDERHDDLIKLCDVGPKNLEWVKTNVDDTTWLERLVYVAPEQLAGDSTSPRSVTPRSDLYSAGVILFQMLTGSVPTEEQPATKLVSLLPKYVPRPLKDVVLRLIQKEPSLRFTSAEQWLTALDQLDGQNQEDDELLSSSPRSAFIAGGMSRTAPPGSVRAASSIRRAPWGLDARGFKLWAVACGLAAVGAAAFVGYRMYAHSGGTLAKDVVSQTTNAQQVSNSSIAEVSNLEASARSEEQWLTLCSHFLGANDILTAEMNFEQALRLKPALIQDQRATLLVQRFGERRAAFLTRVRADTTLTSGVRSWAANTLLASPP